ncbi:ATP-binding cassette sub-family A member 12 isoform X3 [Acanthopagrus latus]|uniref:ATP-binding cassette sub-family A member 12 isoform X3 n=1 Tax=Acanthopagrus latus TaxID=8177 RepID=UPI00187CE997|nr:ATP-binding cassette sub-family A member 12 isoform X3 [Acanthopagrus latus]
MAFFRQLQLLLWKNWLRIIRQPLWSLTLIVWPLIIFIIIAVTRNQFPPVVKETCYVGPRNLPSTGFFPFLQTLMCNTDSTCHNKSRLVDPSASRSSRRSTRSASSDSPGDSPLQDLIKGDFRLDLPEDSSNDLAALMEVLKNMMGPSQQGRPSNVSFTNGSTPTSLEDQETLRQLLESVSVVKRAVCTLMLPMINTTSPDPLSSVVVNFCKSNNTVVEASLQTLNEILTQMMLTKPDEMATAAGFAMLVINQLQNETPLWDTLLAIPRLFSSGSVDQVLRSTEVLLTSIQGAIDVIKSNFPEAGASLSMVRPVLVGGISLLQYVQNWPGKAVSITIGDVVTLQNDSVSEMVKQVLQNVEIPLDKAIALTLDKDMVRGHMCDNSSKPLWLTAACSTGTLDMVLGWISPDLVARQALLAWSKDVAHRDLSFAKGLLHSLMGAPSPGGQGGSNMTKTTRSVDTQPQNTEEDLFLHVGQVTLEVIKMVPEVDMVVQCILRTSFLSMQSASLTFDTVEGMMTNVLEDADQLQGTYFTLLTNQSEASAWTGRVLESVMEVIMKSLTSGNLTCGGVLGPFEWLLNTSSVSIEVWRSMICQNSTSLQDALVMDWMPVAQKVQEVYDTILVKANYSVTPPMILSEWHKLYNKSLQFARLMEKVSTELGEAHWMNWMPDNSTHDITGTLQHSAFLSMVGFGNNIEKSPLWPVVKDYFHMAYWILNYRPGVTVQPANCSVNISNLAVQCDTGLDWSVFVQAATQALMSPNQDVLLNCLKGSVNLLQHVYGDVYKHLVGSYLKQGIQGGDALSAYMINLMNNLDGVVLTISRLSNQNISNPDVMLPLIGNLLQSTGLAPLLPLFTSDGPLNVSTVIEVASKLGRLNQHIFTFSETDPTMPDLERLIMHFLSLEGNLTMSLSNIMGHSLLTYSNYFHPDDIARFREAIKPFTNQTSAGIVEAILSAMELLKKVMDSPNGDATNIILGYTRQLQEFVKSLYRLRKIQHLTLPTGELGANVSDLHGVSKDFLNLLNPEVLMNLTQAGPDAAQDIVTEKFVAFLPPEVQQDAKRFLKDFKALQHHIATCAAGENCLAGISEIFTFLDQISDLMLSADVNVTIKLAVTNSILVGRQYEELTSLFFSLLLPPNDAAYVKTFKQTLHFIRLLMARPNITVSDVQNALRQSNLTLEELDQIAELAGAANINDLMMNIMAIINARQCFEPQHNPLMTAQCVQRLINGVSGFLTNVPALRNATAILSLVPVIANNTISDVLMVNFNSDPQMAVVHTLNSTLANVKKSLQMVHLNTPEIMTEIKVLEGLIQLAANPEPFSNLNTTLMMNPTHAQKVYLQIINFYLTRLANITSTSSVSELLNDFLSLTQMQVALQLAQTDFTLFVSSQVELLMNSLQYPIDGAGVIKIGETAVNILWRQFDLIKVNIEAVNYGPTPICNTTILNITEIQVKQYLSLIKKWMKQPNVPLIITSMLQWGNTSMNISAPVTDFQHLLQTMVNFLSGDQMAYLSIIGNITQSLSKTLIVAEQPGGLQSEQFLDGIMEAVQSLMQNLVSEPPSHTLLQDIREVVEDLIELIVQEDMSVASSRNISLSILKKAGPIIQQTVPEPVTPYFLAGLKVGTTYFVTISEAVGPDTVNQLILNQMETLKSLLPPNSTTQAYISVFINITHFILDSGQGNMSPWATFQNASAENWPLIISKIGQHLSGAIMEAVQRVMQILDLDPPSLMVQKDIQAIVDDLLKLIGQSDMSAPSSRNISLHILKRAERVIQQLVPEMFAEYLLPALRAATTYFETTSTVVGPDTVNQLILNQMETLKSLLPPNSTAQAYISVFINITHFILDSGQGNMSPWATFQNASAENWPLIISKIGQHLSGAIMEAVQRVMQIMDLDPPSLMVQKDIQAIVDDLLKLVGQPDMSAPSSRNISLHILKRAERVIQQLVPEMFAEYLLPALRAATTYFETTSTVVGPDTVNQLILNQMETLKSLLPPNSTAQAYISVFINITHFILDSGQGSMSLWATFEKASAEDLPVMLGKMSKLLSMLWPLIMGGSGSHTTAPSLEGFAHLAPVLEQLMTGEADQDTWEKLEKILETLLSTIRGTELWNSVTAVTPVFEKVIGSEVKNTQAMTELILSLQMPLATLMTEMAQAVNSSRFNLTEVLERMQRAVERTLQAAEQGNGTLTCGGVLQIWEPVREAAGLNQDAMAMWCSVSLHPLLEAYGASQRVYAHMNMSHMGGGPMTVNATAATIVKTVRSLYQVNVNRTHMMEQLVMGFFSQLSKLTGQPLNYETQHHWLKQLQAMQLQYSLLSLRMLTDELLDVAPFLERHIKAVEKALGHILKNYDLTEDSVLPQKLFEEAAMIYLSSANITLNNMLSVMWGNFSGLDETSVTGMMREAVKLMMHMEILDSETMVYEALEEFLASSDTSLIVQRVIQVTEWLGTTQASGLDLLTQALPKVFDILRPLLSLLSQMGVDMGESMELFEDLTGNTLAMLRQLVSTSGLLSPMDHLSMQEMMGGNHTMRSRHRREAPIMPMRSPMDDFVDLFYIDYPAMFRAISVSPTTEEIMETVHVFFANPDLNVVIKGATGGMPWGMNVSREETVDAGLGMLSFLTLPTAVQMSSMDLLANSADLLPDSFPFSSTIRKMTKAIASESQENLILMQRTIGTVMELLKINPTDPQFTRQLGLLRTQVCTLEDTETVRLLMEALPLEPGQLCHIFLPSMQTMVESLVVNMTSLIDAIFVAVIGDPIAYNVQSTWTSVLTQDLNINTNSLRSLNINITSPAAVTVGEMLRNKTAFLADVQRHTDFDLADLDRLMKTTLPNNNLVILSWLVNLRHCGSTESTDVNETDVTKMFCSMSPEQWYSFSLLMARHVNMENLVYRMVLSEELQSFVGVMLQMAKVITNMMNKFLPAISQLQGYLLSMNDLNLVANNEFSEMTRGQRSGISSKATFVTLSRALCRHGILALFGISKLPIASDSSPSIKEEQQREEMIERFKIPRNATPFCQNMYLDMVNTTGGAIAWAFLKPMLMGQILYTPDTPVTRAIMEKANTTLQEFANLRKHSEEWIESSSYVLNSAQLLSHTLPMLQNSLGNSFVRNFIEMQTDINVGKMKETLSSFSNVTEMLEKNKNILKQITTLSTLMVDLSSCITFDRYRGYDSAEQLDNTAQELAKNRDLYASVIFKLPKDDGDGDNDDSDHDDSSSRKRQARSSSSVSSLPPKVSYTIRMHMDNVMRTDRVRNPYFVKDNHISSSMTMRYNRGFVYLQESIDRAIIETQTGQRVTEPAVQLQPFPYPCHLRDEYLEAISFVFPLMLMMAWVLFVADFVKKLVHERELRLHEYMKMMGVNPLSHFFAWFFECATYLTLTIVILTLILKHGGILPHSDGFLLFLYLCDYGLSILAFSYLVSSFFDKTYIAGLSGSLIYILCFFPFIVVMAVETKLTFSQKSVLSLFSPTCFSYASQYVSRYEAQGEGIHWSNSYSSPVSGDTASFGWLCWLMLIDSLLYFIIGAYIRKVFPGNYGIPAPWYFPFKASFWTDMCCCVKSNFKAGRGLLFTNIMQNNQPVFPDDKGKGQSALSSQVGENFSKLPVGVSLHGLSKMYGDRVAIQNLNVSFYEGHVTSLLGHNGAGKTTTMSLLTGLYAPSSGGIEVYGRDMQTNIDDVRKELGVCMQYDVLFDHMTAKEHLLLYGQIKAPQWSRRELSEQIRTILEETGMYAHRHKRVGTLSGGMKRKLSISIAFIGGSRLVVLDEPTTGVDPCSRRSIWDIVIQHKKNRTIIMSTHHLDEAEVLSDRIAFLERGGLKCCGSPLYLKDKLGQGYKLTLTKKMPNPESEPIDNAELKSFIQAHVPEARLKEAQGGDLVYSLPPFGSSNASSYRSLLTALDSNLDALQLGGYGISDTTLEEVFLQLTHNNTEAGPEDGLPTISETVCDTASIDSFPSDHNDSVSNFGDSIKLTGSTMVCGLALAWQQMTAILIKRFQHSRRDWKGLLSQILLPVLFVVFAMGLGSIKKDLQHYPEMELSPELYKFGPSYSFFSNQNPNSSQLMDAMMSFPGIDNACLDKSDDPVCTRSTGKWSSSGNSSRAFSACKCTQQEQVCQGENFQPPHKKIPSAQIVYNLSGLNVENYLVATANKFIRNRYGGFDFGMPLPPDLQMDILTVPKNRTLSKVWYNPEGHHTMPAYLNSMSNLILRSKLPADKDPHKYAISVSSHPYFGRVDDEDVIVQGMLQLLVAICVMTGYSITTASFAIYEVSEHHSGSKRLQHISGISEPFYWAVNFFYDMVMYLIPVTLTVGVFAAFQIPAFTYRENLGAITLLLVLFGFATFPWMYLLSGVFRNAEMAFISYMCINLFISVNTILSTSVLFFLGQIAMRNNEVIQDIFKKLCYAFHIFPQFNFGNGLMKLARMNIEVQILSGYGIDAYINPFSLDALGWMMISSFIQGLVFFVLRLLLNKSLLRKVRHLICGRKTVPQVSPEDQDEDVVAEHLRVSSGAASSDILQVNQLTKIYQQFKKKVHAVKRISVGIPAGECFGLLGVNGAGKTTTFKMLTGDVSPTDGTAQIRDWDGRLVDIMECRNQGINIGYCPQVDALDNLLTGEEHLYFYGRIRGISKRELDGVVKYLLKRLELRYHSNIITDGYSCGTRRKLSTALALIGHPQILLLDEPSSGMDPRTKRHLWKIISEEVRGKCAVVLTSHSMEECEALCSRLAIMVKGQFCCLGSLQHIKNRFGSGFTVKMYLAEASCDTEAITGFMQRRFPSTYLKDQHSTMVEYHVPVALGGVADIFDQLESNKNALQIKHFSVSQTTLDEVFINFAMGKIGMEDRPSLSDDDSEDPGSVKAVET